MIQYLYDNNIIIYAYAGLGGLGLLIRLIVNLVYRHLVKESDNLGETKNKMLKHIKMKFETCYRLKIGVNNVDTFVDKNVLKYRFCGLLLSTWDNFGGQVLFLNLLAVPVLAVFSVFYKCGQDVILFSGSVGILSSAIMILVDKSINIAGKKKMLRLNLLDYLENFCKVRLEQESIRPELIEQHRREFMQVAEANKQISAASAVSKKDEPKDELNRRREARIKKEEERKLQAARREEEQKKAEEARKEEEKRRQEERRLLAVRRREEERLRVEEEKQALEERRAELKRKATEKQQVLELKQKKEEDNKQILHSIEEELKPSEDRTDMNTIIKGLDEIAADREKAAVKTEKDKQISDNYSNGKQQKPGSGKSDVHKLSIQEDKLVEDVLREFFA